MKLSVQGEPETLELRCPVRIGITKTLDVDAARKAAFDGSLTRRRRQKGERA